MMCDQDDDPSFGELLLSLVLMIAAVAAVGCVGWWISCVGGPALHRFVML